MAAVIKNDKYLFEKMSTVLRFPIEGNVDDVESSDRKVEEKVREIVAKLKATHSKFEDPDFGPTEEDEHGALALYGPQGPPPPAGHSKYPPADTIRWDRPQYDHDKFQHDHDEGENDVEEKEEEDNADEDDEFGPKGNTDEVWCMNGQLFIDGSGSGDVIQGKLGDCWFLSALSVIGTQQTLLEKCFWRKDTFKEFGLYVCVFWKDCARLYVLIDDRIPVFESNGKVVFGQCKDPNELWVPLIEKAYSKIHGCYKSLIGGYSHYALADMTGFSPRLLGLKQGFMGYSDAMTGDDVWKTLKRYNKWGCLMGCSIQSKPGAASKVEADVGQGLNMGHAYSLLDVQEVECEVNKKKENTKLVKLRNPWGHGEWTGPWSDDSEQFKANMDKIKGAFDKKGSAELVESNRQDGTFFMKFEGKRLVGQWSGDTGGNREMTTWLSNPKIRLQIKEGSDGKPFRKVFVGLYIKDPRLVLGADYFKDPLYEVGVGFDIVKEKEFELSYKARMERSEKVTHEKAVSIEGSHPLIDDGAEGTTGTATAKESKQPPYMFGTTQIETELQPGVYFIVPSLYKRKQAGTFFINVYVNGDFDLEKGVQIDEENKPCRATATATAADASGPATTSTTTVASASKSPSAKDAAVASPSTSAAAAPPHVSKVAQLTKAQFYEKKENVRDKIVQEAKKLGVSLQDMTIMFSDDDEHGLTRTNFKRKMMTLGFSLADFPDEDFEVLDKDGNGSITGKEFIEFVQEGQQFENPSKLPPPPPPPVDDLLFQPIDLEGKLTVKVSHGKGIRVANTWFSLPTVTTPATNTGQASTTGSDSAAVTGGSHPSTATAATPAVGCVKRNRSYIKYDRELADAARKVPPLRAYEEKRKLDVERKKKGRLDTIHEGEESLLDESMEEGGAAGGRGGGGGGGGRTISAKFKRDPLEWSRSINSPGFDSPGGSQFDNDNEGFSVKSAPRSVAATFKMDKEKEKQIGEEAGKKLHKDSRLIGLEAKRVGFLSKQRAKLAAEHDTSTSKPETSILRKKTRAGRKRYDSLLDNSLTDQEREKLHKKLGWLIEYLDVKVKAVTVAKIFPNSSKSGYVRQSALQVLDVPVSPAPTPGKSHAAKPRSGTTPTPRNRRHDPGTASVSTKISASQQKNMIADAKDKMRQLEAEPVFDEVYRRIVSIPVVQNAQMKPVTTANSSTASSGGLGSWFEFFDKNRNGTISLEEFTLSLRQLNLSITEEDSKTLFARFQTNVNDNVIDWREFLAFFNSYIQRSFDDGKVNASPFAVPIPMAKLLVHMKNKMVTDLQDPNSNFTPRNSASAATASGAKEDKRPLTVTVETNNSKTSASHNAFFTNIDISNTKSNMMILSQLGLNVTEEEMGRISRIFGYTVVDLMDFIRGNPDSDDDVERDLMKGLELARNIMLATFKHRCGEDPHHHHDHETASTAATPGKPRGNEHVAHTVSGGSNSESFSRDSIDTPPAISSSSLPKLWQALAQSTKDSVDFNEICAHMEHMITDYLMTVDNPDHSLAARVYTPSLKKMKSEKLKGNAKSTSAAKAAEPAGAAGKAADKVNGKEVCRLHGIPLGILCRVIIDEMVYSSWNRLSATSATPQGAASGGATSTTAAAKATSVGKVRLISTLSYAGFEAFLCKDHVLTLERKLRYLVLLDVNNGEDRPCTLLVHIYLSSKNNEVMLLAEDPVVGKVHRIQFSEEVSLLPRGDALRVMLRGGAKEPCPLYNPWETPVEDAVFTELCSRLRLVKNGHGYSLKFSEEEKFVSQLRTLLDAAKLPFFSVCDALRLGFECSSEAVKKAGSIRKLVFGELRKAAPLNNFLVNVMSDLDITLSIYDDDLREVLEWSDLLAHLIGFRNPFVCVQLLPRFIAPVEGAPLKDDVDDLPDVDNDGGSDETLKRGDPDIDGGSSPRWGMSFSFDFQPPKLTSCKVLFSDVKKMTVNESTHYFIIMARLGSDASIFLTAYDPRTATEYQCGGAPREWALRGAFVESKIDIFQDQLGKLLDDRKPPSASKDAKDDPPNPGIKLGPAITPRLVLTLFNKRGREEQALGTAQISISSVLSGSGNTKAQWVTLLSDSSSSATAVGEVYVEVSYTRKAEIEARKQSERDRIQRTKDRIAKVKDAKSGSDSAATFSKKKLIADIGESPEVKAVFEENKKLLYEVEQKKKQLEDLKREQEKKALAATSSAPKKAEPTEGKEDTEEAKSKMEAEIALAVRRAQEEAAAQKRKDDELAEAKLQAVAMERKKAEDAHEKAKAETKKLTDDLAAARKLAEKLESDKKRVPLSPSSGELKLPNGSVVMGGLPTDSSLEGIVTHVLKGLMMRYERKPSTEGPFSSLDRILKSLADDRDSVTFSNIDLSLEDLLIDILPAQAEILGRHVGITTQGRVPRKALLKYLNEEAYKMGYVANPQAAPEKVTSKRSAVHAAPLVIPAPTAVADAPGSVDSLRMELKVGNVPITAPSPPTKAKDTAEDMESSQKKRRNRPRSAVEPPSASLQQQDQITLSPSKSTPWDRVALPPNWERRVDQKNGKSYYVNHAEKSTQWHHPSDPDGVGKKKKTKKAAEDNYSSTDRLKGSTLPGVGGRSSNSDISKDGRKTAWGDTA